MKDLKLKAGDTVWVVMRDEGLAPSEFSGFLFLEELSGYVIAAAYPYGYELFEGQLEYFVEQTLDMFNAELMVFPLCDCYASRVEAQEAMTPVIQD